MNVFYAKHSFLLVVLLLIAAIGIFNLNADGIWYDEWWSLYNAGAAPFSDPLSPAQIWERTATDDPWQTPGYPLILSAWGNLVGWSELASRSLSMFAGLIAVALTYRLSRAITHDPRASLAAAALLGGSSTFLYFTHELRVYTIYLAAALALIYTYHRAAHYPRSIITYVLISLSGIALLYMHAFAFVIYALIGVWHVARLFKPQYRQGWLQASIALIIPLITFLPWLSILIPVATATRDADRAQMDISALATIFGNSLYAFSNTAVALFALFAVFSFRQRGSRAVWLIVLLLTPLTLAAYYVTRLSEIRYGIALLPFLAIIGGMGIAALERRRVPFALLIALWIIPAILLARNIPLGKVIQDFYPQPVREMAHILQPYLTDDAEILNYLGLGFRSEQQQTILVHYLERAYVPVLEMETSRTIDTFLSRLDGIIEGKNKLWLLYSPIYQGEEWALVRSHLNQRNFNQCATVHHDNTIQIYAYAASDPATDDAMTHHYADQQLSAQVIGVPQYHEGALVVWLNIENNLAPDMYSAGIHITDAEGVLIAQADQGISYVGDGCLLFRIPFDANADYQANFVIYDWRTGERLQSSAGDTVPISLR